MKTLSNIAFLALLIMPLMVMINPAIIGLFPLWVTLYMILSGLIYLFAAGYFKKWRRWYLDEMMKARIRKQEYAEWVQATRRTRNYKLNDRYEKKSSK